MQDCRTFADAFNYLLYGGKSIIDPEALRPLDTVIIGTPYGADGITAYPNGERHGNLPAARY